MWIVWLIAGLFIGWNLPQPDYAKNIQAKVIAMAKGAAEEAQKTSDIIPPTEKDKTEETK